MTAIYDDIGKTYIATRKADLRITRRAAELLALAPGSSLIDVGAGTGNYSCALAELGYQVTAVEPSRVMREQGRQHPNLHWQEGVAESLPFGDGEFAGAVMTLCLHHFNDWRKGIAESQRVCGNGPLVIFLFDARCRLMFWLDDYFPDLARIDAGYAYTIEAIREFASSRQLHCETYPFPLPPDLDDHFLASGWARPQIYLDEKYRAGISSFARIETAALGSGLASLEQDLESGDWLERYGEVLQLDELDLGYQFMKFTPIAESR